MKIIGILLVVIVALSLIGFWYQVFIMGNYYAHAGFLMVALGALVPVVILYGAYKIIQEIKSN